MRMWHIACFIICMNFSLGIVRGLGIFHVVPVEHTSSWASWTGTTQGVVVGLIMGAIAALGLAKIFGITVPVGAVVFATVFGVSSIPLAATLSEFATIDGWPAGLNVAILGLIGFVFIWSFIQLASVGGKVVE